MGPDVETIRCVLNQNDNGTLIPRHLEPGVC